MLNEVLPFFVLAYAISWLLSIVATPGPAPATLPPILRGLAGILLHYGPSLAALCMTGLRGGRAAVKALLRPLLSWRVGWRWYVFVLLYPLAARVTAASVHILIGGTPPIPFSAGGIPAANPVLLFVPLFIGVFFQAGLAEEIGWRGFALPRLQNRYSALASSLILGIVWALWHFHPLNWAVMHANAVPYVLGAIPMTILFTWVYNSTGRSLLLAVLFHTASNVSDWILPVVPFLSSTGTSHAYVFLIVINSIVAMILVITQGSRRLTWPKPVV